MNPWATLAGEVFVAALPFILGIGGPLLLFLVGWGVTSSGLRYIAWSAVIVIAAIELGHLLN